MITIAAVLVLLALACGLHASTLIRSAYRPLRRRAAALFTAAAGMLFCAGAAFHIGVQPWI